MRPDATSALLRAIRLRIGEGADLAVERIVSRAWASATFAGVRHAIDLRLGGPDAEAAADAFAHGIEEADFALRGHFLADISIAAQRRHRGPGGMVVSLSIEALTVEE